MHRPILKILVFQHTVTRKRVRMKLPVQILPPRIVCFQNRTMHGINARVKGSHLKIP